MVNLIGWCVVEAKKWLKYEAARKYEAKMPPLTGRRAEKAQMLEHTMAWHGNGEPRRVVKSHPDAKAG